MARKKFNQQNDFPGLFDDFNVTAPQESVPVHPDIEKRAKEPVLTINKLTFRTYLI